MINSPTTTTTTQQQQPHLQRQQQQQQRRKLTEKQEKFLHELLHNGGHVKNAIMAAGYKEQSRSWLTRTLRNEIIERTRSMLATNSVKAANRIIEGLDADGTVPLNQMDMRLKTAESVLDRVGLGKKQQIEMEGQILHGIVMLPSKDRPKEIVINSSSLKENDDSPEGDKKNNGITR